MKYETTTEKFLGEWNFKATFTFKSTSVSEASKSLDYFLKEKATGSWLFLHNTLYLNELDDIFKIRLLFDHYLVSIAQAK